MLPVKGHFLTASHGGKAFLHPFGICLLKSNPLKKSVLHPYARCQEKGVEPKLRPWHIFIIQINIIPRRQLYLKLIVLGAAGSASHMVNHCCGTVQIVVAKDLGPPAHVDILQIAKMLLVKIPDGLKDLPPVDGCPGAGGEHLTGPVVACAALAHAPLVSPSHHRIHIPRVVHQIPVVKLYHLAADGKDLLRAPDGS